MLDWHSGQICYPLEIKILLLVVVLLPVAVLTRVQQWQIWSCLNDLLKMFVKLQSDRKVLSQTVENHLN